MKQLRKNDVLSAFHQRWVHSFNTAAPGHVVEAGPGIFWQVGSCSYPYLLMQYRPLMGIILRSFFFLFLIIWIILYLCHIMIQLAFRWYIKSRPCYAVKSLQYFFFHSVFVPATHSWQEIFLDKQLGSWVNRFSLPRNMTTDLLGTNKGTKRASFGPTRWRSPCSSVSTTVSMSVLRQVPRCLILFARQRHVFLATLVLTAA